MISSCLTISWARDSTSLLLKNTRDLIEKRSWRTEEWHSGARNCFSDEKFFTIEVTVNNQNARVYTKTPAVIDEFVRTVYRLQNLFSLMVWIAIYKYWKSLLIFVEQWVKINGDLYVNNIFIPAFQEMKKYFKDQLSAFQQDGAPIHTSGKTQDWCQRHFPWFWSNEIPASPDLNPVLVRSSLKAKICLIAQQGVDV